MTVYITVKASDLQSAWRTTQLSKGRATDEMAVRRRREDALGIAAKSDEWTPDSLERSIQKVKSKRQLTRAISRRSPAVCTLVVLPNVAGVPTSVAGGA